MIKIYIYSDLRTSELINFPRSSFINDNSDDLIEFKVVGKGDKKRDCFINRSLIQKEWDWFQSENIEHCTVSLKGSLLDRVAIWKIIISTLKVNDKYVMNIITVYTAYTDAFIIDYEGVLYQQLLSELKPDYKNAYKTMPRFNSDYDYSLVRFNVFEGYFSRDADIFGK